MEFTADDEKKAGGKLVKYKVSTDKVLQIEPKEVLEKRTGKSPDYAEAFILTFTPRAPEPNIR